MVELDQAGSNEALPKQGVVSSTAGSSQPMSSRSPRPRLSAAQLVMADDETQLEAQAPAAMEAVVVGHLPTRAGPWVAQYARALSEQIDEPVALVRLAADRLSLDVIGIGLDDGGVGESSSFDAAAASIGGRVGAWLISASDLAEPELCLDPRVDRVTLLCTNDDSGILATYRTIRQLMAWDTVPRGVAVAPLGVEAHHAEAVWTRLREATRELLDGNLELSAFVERMGPTGAAAVYWTDTPEPLDRVLSSISRAMGGEPAGDAPAGVQEAHGRTKARARGRKAGGEARLAGRIEPGASDGVVAGRATAPNDLSARGEDVKAHKPALELTAQPKVSASRGAGAPAAGGEGGASGAGVANLIPGLTKLGMGCPVDPAIELAVDGAGRLQVVLLDEPERAAYRLHAAARWARVNAASLAAGAGPSGVRIDASLEPKVHLVVRRGVLAEPALALDWQVHLLIERQSAGMSVRVLEPLRGPSDG